MFCASLRIKSFIDISLFSSLDDIPSCCSFVSCVSSLVIDMRLVPGESKVGQTTHSSDLLARELIGPDALTVARLSFGDSALVDR